MNYRAHRLILALLLTVIGAIHHADDAGYDGDGGTVFPIRHSEIAMTHETIAIRIDREAPPFYWQVDVTMHFANRSDKPVSVQMGFPFAYWTCEENQNSCFGDARKHFGFKTWVDGKPVNTVEKRGIANPKDPLLVNFPSVFVTQVRFAPRGKHTVRHVYNSSGYSDSIGNIKNRYILRTGGYWAEPIGAIDISLELPRDLIRPGLCYHPAPRSVIEEGTTVRIRWHFEKVKPDFDLVEDYNHHLHRMIRPSDEMPPLPESEIFSFGYSACGLQQYLNSIYARHGYPFHDEYLRILFYGGAQTQFRERSDFKPEDITPAEYELIGKLKQYILDHPDGDRFNQIP